MAAALAPELLVQLEQGPFRDPRDLLGTEEWDAALFGCLDDRLGPAHLFPSLDPDPMFDCAFDGGGGADPPDPPWDQEPPRLFPDLQVKSEPGSPHSSPCSDCSCPSEPPLWVCAPSPPRAPPAPLPPSAVPPQAPTPPELGVKPEPEPPPLQDPAKSPRVVKAEGTPPTRRTPPIQPKPPGGGTPSPPQTILLQPLPGAAPPTAIAVPAPAVLLSPAELLLPGVLCLPTPQPRGPPKPEAKTIVPAPAPAPPGPPEVDVKVLRRQQRMIKNRESASQSRRRRKEYVQGLELRLRQALSDNEVLRRENRALRAHLDTLLAQGSELRPPGPAPRRLACLGALLLLAFHLGPLSLSQPPQLAEPPRPPEPSQGRRHLLGVPDGAGPPPEVPLPPVWGPPPGPPQEPEPPGARTPFRNASIRALPHWDLEGSPRSSDCRRFNRTESLRLADELRGWVRRHQRDRRDPGVPLQPPRSQFQASFPWKGPVLSRFVPAMPPHPERTPLGQLQLFHLPEPRILGAIDRRDDTFYVVSFRRDHLLLPAISHNKTSRPKMSLVMPAAALNESLSGRGGALQAMMKVDCEVMDTRVIHVRRRRGHAPPSAGHAPSRTGHASPPPADHAPPSPPANRSAAPAPHLGGAT